MKLSIVIPAYNEKNRIANMLNSYIRFFNNNKYDYEIIVVCDGTDGTNQIIKDIASIRNNIKLIESKFRQGKGSAIIKGFKICEGDIISFVDADESVLPEEFEKLIHYMDCIGSIDCSIASRRAEGSYIRYDKSLIRKIPSKIFNIIVNVLFDLQIKDTQCGAKVFKREVIEKVLPSLQTKGFEFDVELLWRIKKEGYTIREIPITWKHDNESKFNLNNSFGMLWSLIKIKIGYINL